MSSNNEIQRSSHENQLLNELQSTVKSRWNEFDNALPTGASFKSEYQSMKNAYDWLIADLSSVKTDEELKKNQVIKGKIDDFLNQLGNYLKREDRRKDLDGTLTETNTQIAELRNKIYVQQVAQSVQAESGKLQQEVATNKPASTSDKKQESLPTTAQAAATVAAVGGGTGVVAAIESGGKKAEEAVKGIMKPLEKIKKWSSDIGDAWDAGWELVKKGDISKGIWLFFAVLFGANLKDALAKYTWEKQNQVDDGGHTDAGSEIDVQAQQTAENEVIASTARHLIRGADKKEYGNFISAAWGWVTDRSFYKDETDFQNKIENISIGLITSGSLSMKRFSDIHGKSEKQLMEELWSDFDLNTKKSVASLINKMLSSNVWSFENVFWKGKFEDISMRDILRKLYYEKGYGYVLKMDEKLANLDIKNVADLPKDMFLELKMVDGKISTMKWTIIDDRLAVLQSQWLTSSLMQNIMFDHQNLSVDDFSKTITKISPQEKNFLTLITNRDKFLNPLKNSLNHHFGIPPDVLKKMDFANLSMKDILEIYMITGGNPDIAKLNFWEQSLLSLKSLALFSRVDPNGLVDYLRDVAEKKSQYPIIAKVWWEAWALANRGAYNLASISTDVVVRIARMAGIDTTPEVAAAIASVWWAIWVIAKFLPIGRLISLIVLAWGGIAVVGTAAAQQSANSK